MSMRWGRGLLGPLVVLVVLSGCMSHEGHHGEDGGHGGHGSESGAGNLPVLGTEDVVLNVTAGSTQEYRFSPDRFEVVEGQRVEVRFVNEGSVDHEFDIESLEFHLHAVPGNNASAAFIAPSAGTYTIGCYVPGHFDLGMRATLEVLPATADA